jgi:hypothetical protein
MSSSQPYSRITHSGVALRRRTLSLAGVEVQKFGFVVVILRWMQAAAARAAAVQARSPFV